MTMGRLFQRPIDLHGISPLTLAFVGDGVYGLMVREWLTCEANRPIGELHDRSVKLVCAQAQAAAVGRLLPLLSDEETAVFKRGRNAHTSRSGNDYHYATGLETLFGYLYLSGNTERLHELFSYIMQDVDKA